MTISIWRYSHLALAVSSFILLTLASVTGIILSFQPLSEKRLPYRVADFNEISLAEILPNLRKQYPEISEITVDPNQFVTIKGSDADGKKLLAYIDPRTGKILGFPEKKSEFFEWVTALHRSLFIHETGRFFIGLTAFLLLLITILGAILIIQRQRGVKRFFTKIVRENFSQYYHVVLGRLSLVIILIIALSGTYLSLARFGLIETPKYSSDIDFEAIRSEPVKKTTEFKIFKIVKLSEVQTIEFPFSEDVEDFYTLKLDNREVSVNQITGEILSEVKYLNTELLTELCLDLHTGRTSAVWAIVLALATANILFFIYSGFAMTFKRRAGRVKNMHSSEESEFIILVGSENGSTFGFANAMHKELIAGGKTAYVTELNKYRVFPKASHIIVMTATYGLGNPPTNSRQFELMLKRHPQPNPVNFSVVGFGSHGYPDFCKFAFEVDNLFSQQKWAVPMIEIHTVNDKSPDEFGQWANTWSQHADVPLTITTGPIATRQEKLESLTIVEKTEITGPGDAFLIRMLPTEGTNFTSGDLLAIYPANDHRERLYSIGKMGNEIQLSVKLHENGLGSDFLSRLEPGTKVKARIVSNAHFHLPKTSCVIMISNGTGIAPFLGMIDERTPNSACHLYCGFRDESSFGLYKSAMEQSLLDKKLTGLQIAYSRQGEKQYVKDLLARDEALIVQTLSGDGVIMLCGSLSMQNNVVTLLEMICQKHIGKPVSFFQSHGKILMDCY